MPADLVIYCLEQITDFEAFEHLCNNLMAIEGYHNIEPLGGVRDAGRDAIHCDCTEGGEVTIFAYSARKDWRTKLFEDAEKVQRHQHACDQFVFVCTSKFTTTERDQVVAKVKRVFGWKLDLYGLERLRLLLVDRPDILLYHPQIFPPNLLELRRPPLAPITQGRTPLATEARAALEQRRDSMDEIRRVESDNYEWIHKTRSYQFQRLLQSVQEIGHPAGRLEAGRIINYAIRKSGARTGVTSRNILQLCEELDGSALFQLNWRLRRMFARVVGDILGIKLGRKDQRLIDRFCEPRLYTPHGVLLLAEAATEHSRAASAIGAPTLYHLLRSKQPQVPWQLLKHWSRISPILPADISLTEVFNASTPLIRRRLFLTRLLTARRSNATMKRFLRDVKALSSANPLDDADPRFCSAIMAWAALNTSVAVSDHSPRKLTTVRIYEMLQVASVDHIDFTARVSEALELDSIERDLRLAEGGYQFHPTEGFSEGRYGYTRHYVRRAISAASRDQLNNLLHELLRCADEGIRWAVAADVLNWWALLPESEMALKVVFRLIDDDHPWVAREVLQQLARDPILCQAINVVHLVLRAEESRRKIQSAGWQTGELIAAIRRIAVLDH